MKKFGLLVAFAILSPVVQAATDAACKPVIDADKARAAAQAWHTRKNMGGQSMELIRMGDDIYANMGATGWKKMPPGMAQQIGNAGNNADKFTVNECSKLGSEKVGGVATTIYSFKTTIPGQPPFSGKVWIGDKDGLPYREEGDRHSGTTSYEGVTVPALK
ncbi:MAG: hypothetical protein ACREUE_08800 [Panacagrimonas sp.]